jgi:hypothetical protein
VTTDAGAALAAEGAPRCRLGRQRGLAAVDEVGQFADKRRHVGFVGAEAT